MDDSGLLILALLLGEINGLRLDKGLASLERNCWSIVGVIVFRLSDVSNAKLCSSLKRRNTNYVDLIGFHKIMMSYCLFMLTIPPSE